MIKRPIQLTLRSPRARYKTRERQDQNPELACLSADKANVNKITPEVWNVGRNNVHRRGKCHRHDMFEMSPLRGFGQFFMSYFYRHSSPNGLNLLTLANKAGNIPCVMSRQVFSAKKYTNSKDKVLLFIIAVSLTFSCRQEFIKPNENKSYIVVDGWIENDKPAYIILTRNTPYFTIVDSSSFINLIINIAKVTVSDGENTEVCTLGRRDDLFPPFVYRTTEMRGETGKTYHLEVILRDTVLTATTFIPEIPQIDTAWFEIEPPNDSLGTIKLKFTDDNDTKNYYRILTRNLDEEGTRYIPVMSSAVDDIYFEKAVNVYPLFKGQDSPVDDPADIYYKTGDRISIKLCSVDRESYQFWRAYQYESINAVNPFASSNIDVTGNIVGEGIGIWSGEGASYYTISLK